MTDFIRDFGDLAFLTMAFLLGLMTLVRTQRQQPIAVRRENRRRPNARS